MAFLKKYRHNFFLNMRGMLMSHGAHYGASVEARRRVAHIDESWRTANVSYRTSERFLMLVASRVAGHFVESWRTYE